MSLDPQESHGPEPRVIGLAELRNLPPIPPCPVCGRAFSRVMPHAQYHGNIVECEMGHRWDARV